MAALEKAFPLLPSIVRFTRSYVVDELLTHSAGNRHNLIPRPLNLPGNEAGYRVLVNTMVPTPVPTLCS